MAKQTFIYDKLQQGAWGSTVIGQIKVKAADEFEADHIVFKRKDYGKCLANGDRIRFQRSNN